MKTLPILQQRLRAFLLSILLSSSLGTPAWLFAGNDGDLIPKTILQLENVRQSSAKYFDVDLAESDGYSSINLFVPNMGHHYLNGSLLDGEFDPSKPEILVYSENCDGSLKLVAVEYAIPTDISPNPPKGFVGKSDEWFNNETFGLWVLHVWVYEYNPDGVFSAYNIRVD